METYSFGVRVPLKMGQPEEFDVAQVRGRYFGSKAIPGIEDGQIWSFFLSFKGLTKTLELRGPHFTAEEKARKKC